MSCSSLLAQAQQSTPQTPKATSIILSPPQSSSIPTSSQSVHYMHRLINGLIELFEKHFHSTLNCFTKSCIKIFDILTRYLESFYPRLPQPSSTAPSLEITQLHSRLFNYYATIRRDIFEFLLRIRSDSNNKVLLSSRTDRRKFTESKFLILHLSKFVFFIIFKIQKK